MLITKFCIVIPFQIYLLLVWYEVNVITSYIGLVQTKILCKQQVMLI